MYLGKVKMRLFVTGTDTNVGKTVVSAWLSYHLKTDYWKPIQTGCEEDLDSQTIAKLANLQKSQIHPEAYRLKAPLSPHAAASLENISISLNRISLPQTKKPLIIEGAGGILVPLNESDLIIDLIHQLQTPVIIVARSRLGTINHTCLTLEALRNRNITVLGVILNGPLNPSNKTAIEKYGKIKVLAELETFNPLTVEALASKPLPENFYHFLKDFL
jgi:dethiobiotin synthetase/malonyl-CoA O-methyltransferase